MGDRTVLSVQSIIELLGFCLHTTYFSFQNIFHEQIEGAAEGEKKKLSTTSIPLGFG